jgi:hypothetical protein
MLRYDCTITKLKYQTLAIEWKYNLKQKKFVLLCLCGISLISKWVCLR